MAHKANTCVCIFTYHYSFVTGYLFIMFIFYFSFRYHINNTNTTLFDAGVLVGDGRENLTRAQANFEELQRESSRLDPATDKLTAEVNRMTNASDHLEPLVQQALQHALDLKQQADDLER